MHPARRGGRGHSSGESSRRRWLRSGQGKLPRKRYSWSTVSKGARTSMQSERLINNDCNTLRNFRIGRGVWKDQTVCRINSGQLLTSLPAYLPASFPAFPLPPCLPSGQLPCLPTPSLCSFRPVSLPSHSLPPSRHLTSRHHSATSQSRSVISAINFRP